MKNLVLLVLGLAMTLSIQAQTKLIAHKSRSGNMAAFSPSVGPDNIGEIMVDPKFLHFDTIQFKPLPYPDKQYVDTLIKLSDSALLEISKIPFEDSVFRLVDTIVYQPSILKNNGIPTGDIETYYPKTVKFLGFDSSKTAEPLQTIPVADTLKQTIQKDELTPTHSVKSNNGPMALLWIGVLILVVSMAITILVRHKSAYQ